MIQVTDGNGRFVNGGRLGACLNALGWQGGTVQQVAEYLCFGCTYNVRRYPDGVYHSREVLCKGKPVGVYEGYAADGDRSMRAAKSGTLQSVMHYPYVGSPTLGGADSPEPRSFMLYFHIRADGSLAESKGAEWSMVVKGTRADIVARANAQGDNKTGQDNRDAILAALEAADPVGPMPSQARRLVYGMAG